MSRLEEFASDSESLGKKCHVIYGYITSGNLISDEFGEEGKSRLEDDIELSEMRKDWKVVFVNDNYQ
jgi:hypothetical protein